MGILPHPSTPFSGADLLAAGQPSSAGGDHDPVETYFECITACSLDDGECVTQCVEVLRSTDSST
jgi:hypothetical protein